MKIQENQPGKSIQLTRNISEVKKEVYWRWLNVLHEEYEQSQEILQRKKRALIYYTNKKNNDLGINLTNIYELNNPNLKN